MDQVQRRKKGASAPTMIDVARTAGVSIATVSAYMNRSARVSDELTRRIEAAIGAIGYERNAIARSLKTGATHTIGLTVADIRNPFFTDVVATIQQVLNSAGYAVMLCSSDENTARQDEQIKLLLDRMVDGLIIAPAGDDAVMTRLVKSTRKPVVLIDRLNAGLDVDAVVIENATAVFEVIRYVIDLGHRRIGFVSGPSVASTGRDRLAGYYEALRHAGIGFDQMLVCNGNFREDDGYRAAMRLLTQPDRPTAIFSANNLMVIGALRAIRDLGLSCPDDVSVACIDDFSWADVFSPQLTAVAQPVKEIGEQAARLLLERLSGVAPPEPRLVRLQGELMVRGSCAPLS
ncbi:LacI family DNA-binding transcriptional regulator [Paracoccus pacificus]|uniref:LacI family DNA-binding transcriptional regulator n=1 Tax=Paracoccus pacificus TaxID=1463598 RepID=A0ABW4R876_9RHOB